MAKERAARGMPRTERRRCAVLGLRRWALRDCAQVPPRRKSRRRPGHKHAAARIVGPGVAQPLGQLRDQRPRECVSARRPIQRDLDARFALRDL